VDITLKELKNINDLYKDGTTFVEILEKPQKPAEGDFRPGMTYSTASPFTDSRIKLHIKLQVDDEVLHDDFDSEPVTYEMEDYHMPAVLRRVLKMSKLNEIVQITSDLKYKLLDHISDTKNSIFVIDKMKEFEKNIKITFKLLSIQQKEHVLKVPIQDRLLKL
tara:strand:+ start:122 stop:610 length:489 start_codon:yes stop_codon:yes gene_type:complete